MAVKTGLYAPSKLTQDTGIGPSNSIWYDCPFEEWYQEPNKGYYFFDHFLSQGRLLTNVTTNFVGDKSWLSWAATNAVNSTDNQQDGGILTLGAGANANVDICLTQMAGWARMISAATGFPLTQGKLWFECRVAMGNLTASQRDMFIGMSDNGTTIAASGGFYTAADTLSTTPGIIGFRARGGATNPGDFGFVYNVAGGTVQAPSTLTTLGTTVTGTAPIAFTAGATGALATGFIKLGFVFDPTPGNPPDLVTSALGGQAVGDLKKRLVNVYVNGQQAPSYLTAKDQVQVSTFPSSWLAPTIAFRSANTAAGAFLIDWIRVAQAANSL